MIKLKDDLSTKQTNLVNSFRPKSIDLRPEHIPKRLAKTLSNTKNHIQDLVPQRCLFCAGQINHTQLRNNNMAIDNLQVCQGCLLDLPWNSHHCQQCSLPLHTNSNGAEYHQLNGVYCGECVSQTPSFDRIIAPFIFDFPIDHAIRQFKYEGKRYYRSFLSGALIQAIKTSVSNKSHTSNDQHLSSDLYMPNSAAIIPIPQDPRRKRERPFHHTRYLAHALSRRVGIKTLDNVLIKTTSTPTQAGLKRKERLRNLKNCFEVKGPIPKQIVLVDDVVTTGATAERLAALLKRHGAQTVDIWAIARTPS